MAIRSYAAVQVQRAQGWAGWAGLQDGHREEVQGSERCCWKMGLLMQNYTFTGPFSRWEPGRKTRLKRHEAEKGVSTCHWSSASRRCFSSKLKAICLHSIFLLNISRMILSCFGPKHKWMNRQKKNPAYRRRLNLARCEDNSKNSSIYCRTIGKRKKINGKGTQMLQPINSKYDRC